MKQFTRGNLTVIPLSEGSFTIDSTKMFVPFDETAHALTDRPTGSLLVEIQPFLVQTPRDLLLLDAGLGYLVDGELQIHKNIRSAGFRPEDVTKVLLTHLHKDHAGGIGYAPGRSTNEQLAFSNATYYVRRQELDFAWKKGLPSYITDEIEPLLHSPQVHLLHEDSGVIDGYIRYQHTGGHCPEHQVFWISAGNNTVFFGGDVAPQLQQMKVRYKTKYDYDPQRAVDLRQLWWQEGNAAGWMFLFYHDIKNPVYTSSV